MIADQVKPTNDQAGPVNDQARPVKTRSWADAATAPAAVALTVLVAFGLRAFHIDTSWNVFVDEINYLHLAQGVLQTGWIVGREGPFYLHPPAYFFLEAGYIKLFDVGGDTLQQIYGVRYLGAALAGLTTGALLWAGRRLAGWPAGIAVAAIFALDPFSIRINSRNMLETPAMLWVLLGYLVLFSALVSGDRRRVSWWRALGAGALFGLALLTKDLTAFLSLLPLGLCFLLGWALPRAQTVVIGTVAVLVYAPYPLTVYAIGDWPLFVEQKLTGASRLAGILQLTGFNASGGPSFTEKLVSQLGEFATTYACFAAGAGAVVILLFTDLGKTPARRLLLAWSASSYALLAYLLVFGTLEEPFFYYLVVPAMLTTVVTAAIVLGHLRASGAGGDLRAERRRARTAHRWRPVLGATAAVFVAASAAWSAYVWTAVHTVPDNGYERAVSYVERLPEDSRVAATSQAAEFLMEDPADQERYESIKALKTDRIEYVVVSEKLASEGWDQPPPKVYRWVKDRGERTYSFAARNDGLFEVWRIPDGTGGKAASPGSAKERSDTR